ncbi:hypothetical protein [Anabaena sp. UHCC 0451]|uniref:hypothetical protein n=1 Tax=Anabaena sp. UHCC 0451 TaxID=2055235 RepID=UPI002B1FF706|nr:hypothetical protein [Anabaena sp. UHCC 0451]MEA5579339.1 hypothetical protein [Anabaena sp. UHCC 0451]
MAQPTTSDLFDNETTLINSAVYDAVSTSLTITFSQNVSPLQAFAAIVQSGHKWLLANTDLTVNASANQPNTNSTSRNGENKEQTSLSCVFYTPMPDVTFDPTLL